MKFSTLIQATVVALYATMAATAAIPIFDTDSSTEDHPLAKRDGIRFTGSLYPGGPEVDLTGTLNEIIPELKKLYPDLNTVSTTTTSASSPNPLLAKRVTQKPKYCLSGKPADRYVIYNHALPYLKAIENLTCELPIGYGCFNVYCSPAPRANWFTTRKIPCKSFVEVAELIIKNCEDGPQRGIRGQIVTSYSGIGFKVGIGSAECLGTNSGLS
ncbi:hypothetical protein TWF970_001509 [Orbilia oligospora]|uniref:Uncharacterized protein n=1 Tax=Orbilia oligospora TaxID=2813651 RepID=A0A7C8RJG2_ORBOL|nr:hypothetical protein TWF970_001509 [Orbilia oligospora]